MPDIKFNPFVEKIRGYGRLSDEEVRLLVNASAPPRNVPQHRDLIREGDKPGPLFVILEGWAYRYKVLANGSRQIIAFMIPGDFCDLHVGELDRMDHSIGTLTSCKISNVARERVETLIVSTPALTRAFWRAQLIDEGVLRAWIVGLGRRDSIERIAHLMLELYLRMRSVGLTDDHTCEVPFTQTVLADAVGLTPVHVNRSLKKLREQRIMEFGAGKLRILDGPALAKVAGFDDNYLHRRLKQAA